MRGRGGHGADVARQAANVVGAAFQIAAAALAGPEIGRVADEYGTFALPAGYAFAIWTPIFALSLIYAGYAALPAKREDPLLQRVGWFTAAAFFLNGLWEVLFPARQLVASQVVLAGVFVASGGAYLIVQRQISASRSNVPLSGGWLVAPAAGLFFGWVTAATLVGLSATLAGLGLLSGGLSEALLAGALLLVGGLVASAALLAGRIGPSSGYLAYAAASLWALVAVVVEQYDASALATGAAVVAAALVAAVLVVVAREDRSGRRNKLRPRTVR